MNDSTLLAVASMEVEEGSRRQQQEDDTSGDGGLFSCCQRRSAEERLRRQNRPADSDAFDAVRQTPLFCAPFSDEER
jgi:hypothetical protein